MEWGSSSIATTGNSSRATTSGKTMQRGLAALVPHDREGRRNDNQYAETAEKTIILSYRGNRKQLKL